MSADEIIQALATWDDCAHEWRETLDSQFSSELFTDVVCMKCKCPGEMDNRTKKVSFPAT